MNTKQIKKFLIDKDLTVAEMARQLVGKPGITSNESSLAQMLSEMINGRRWYPTLAEQVNAHFGLNLVRPAHYEPKVRLKQAA